jgi:hypothetical protein
MMERAARHLALNNVLATLAIEFPALRQTGADLELTKYIDRVRARTGRRTPAPSFTILAHLRRPALSACALRIVDLCPFQHS